MGVKSVRNYAELEKHRDYVSSCVEAQMCTECLCMVGDFSTEGAQREWIITGMCENCQDVLWEGKHIIRSGDPTRINPDKKQFKGTWLTGGSK